MADVKMTRKEFFGEFKKMVSSIEDDKCASDWLEMVNNITDDDFEKGDEVITVNADDILDLGKRAYNHDGFSENIELSMMFGLKKAKFNELSSFGYTHARSGIGSMVSMACGNMYDRIEEIEKVKTQTEFTKNDNAYDIHGWLRDAFEASDLLGESKNWTVVSFYEHTNDGERKLNAGEAGDALSAGKVIYCHHPDHELIPLIKDKSGKVVSGDGLLNMPESVPERTEIPEVRGFFNTICKWLHIETSGTKAYFDAKRLEKSRNNEAAAKNAELNKAKGIIRNSVHFITSTTLKIDEEKAKNIEKEKQNPAVSYEIPKEYVWKDTLEEEVNNRIGREDGELEVYSKDLRRMTFAQADKLLNKGATLYAKSTTDNRAFKFNRLGKDGSVLFGDYAVEAEKERDIRRAMNDMVGSYDTLYELAHGAPRIKDGENERKWKDKAYINLRTNKNYDISALDSDEREQVTDGINDWIEKNRKDVIENYKRHCDILGKEKSDDVIDYLTNLDGKGLFSFLETKQEESKAAYKTSKLENQARIINEAKKKLSEGAEKSEAVENDEVKDDIRPEIKEEPKTENVKENEKSLKGQEIIDAERKKAYSVLCDTASTPSEIADSIATIMVCHTLSSKSAIESDIISRKNGGAKTLEEIDAEKGQNIKTRAAISDKPELIGDAVNKLKESPAFGYYASELNGIKKDQAENEGAKHIFFMEQRGKLAVRGFMEKAPLGDPAPVKAESMAVESLLIKTFNEKNVSLTASSVKDVIEEVRSKELEGKELK